MDIDNATNGAEARNSLIKLIRYLNSEFKIHPDDLKIYFSGNKGYHVEIPEIMLGEIMKQISFAGSLSEEDKMYVASIAQMGDGGEYTIKVKDEKGEFVDKKLTDLSEKGLTTAKGMSGLYDSLHKVGLSAGEIEKFGIVITPCKH